MYSRGCRVEGVRLTQGARRPDAAPGHRARTPRPDAAVSTQPHVRRYAPSAS